jgi:UDP-glucose 4-epimerase
MLAGKRPVIFGDGEQSRDFTFVANVVRGNLLACHASGVAGKMYNLACSERISLNQVVTELNKILGTSLEPIYEASRVGDIKHSLADISRAKTGLKYAPSVQFHEGLRITVDWYRAH